MGYGMRSWIAVGCLACAGLAAADETAGDRTELLRKQVEYLADALAKAKVEADGLRAKLDRQELEKIDAAAGIAAESDKEWKILDVNRDLGMAILNVGRRNGVRPGIRMAVVQKDKSVAALRVVDVRAGIAGAVIENVGRGVYPKTGDRLIVAKGSAE